MMMRVIFLSALAQVALQSADSSIEGRWLVDRDATVSISFAPGWSRIEGNRPLYESLSDMRFVFTADEVRFEVGERASSDPYRVIGSSSDKVVLEVGDDVGDKRFKIVEIFDDKIIVHDHQLMRLVLVRESP